MPGGEPIVLHKRYSDYEAFYTSLITKFPYLVLPSFPPKDMLMNYNKDEEKIRTRHQALQAFFCKLKTNSLLLHTNYLTVLQQFKSESKPPSRSLLDSAFSFLDLLGSHG